MKDKAGCATLLTRLLSRDKTEADAATGPKLILYKTASQAKSGHGKIDCMTLLERPTRLDGGFYAVQFT